MKKAGMLYVSNISSVSFSLFCLVFHYTKIITKRSLDSPPVHVALTTRLTAGSVMSIG